ncbi:MAG: ATP-binding protein [Rhodospirillales bacterium]|nr:ATP-binding protein [Rhodospirillales bacterium]MDP6646491.1 ATP-binding protein [Rhodospirillales bacterium]
MAAESEFTLMRRGMDSLGMAVLWARPQDGRVVYGNRAALALFDCSEQELLSRRMADIDAAFGGGGWSDFIAELRASGSFERETILLGESERPLLVNLSSSLAVMDGEETVICFCHPISESPEAARTLDAQLALIAESLPILIARVDRNLRFTYVNKGYEQLFGRDRKELVGRKLEEVLGAEDMPGLQPFIKRVFLGETVTFERVLYGTALGERVLRGTFAPDTSKDGQVVGYFVFGQDITAEADIRDAIKLSEASAVQAQRQLLDAIESISAGFALFDSDDRLVVCNSRFSSAFPEIEKHIKPGARFEEIARRYADTFKKLRTNERAREEFIQNRLDHFRNVTGSFEYSTSDGTWYRVTDSRTQDGGGVIVHADITESKLRETQLLAAKNEADSINRMKTEFLANMSHELRTPLNAIIGFSDIIEGEMFGPVTVPKYLEYITDIKQSGVHLLEVINDMLDISKVESGTFILDRKPVDLSEVVETSLRLVAPRAEQKNLHLSVKTVEDMPVMLGDRRRIVQLVLNLLSNAIKFTPDGGSIETRIERTEAGDVKLSVSDTGIGVEAKHLNNIVDPFFQADGTLARRHEGTGLGLTLCKMFVELHGGSLNVASEYGEGTVITARFPAEIMQDAKDAKLPSAADG